MPVREPVSKVQVEPPTPQKAEGRRVLFKALTNSVICVAAFLITCAGLRAVLPFPEIDGGVSQKFRFFAAHKDEFDTLFIGSSRIYFQISPAVFDRVTRESGMPTRSFNFGIGGMYLPESAYLLEQILNLKPRNLRWVFIEYEELQTEWSPENQTSRRALYWADWKRVSLLLRKLTDAGTDPLWRLDPVKVGDIMLRRKDDENTRSLVTFYTGQFEKNYANAARAGDVLEFSFNRDKGEHRAGYLGAGSDGYVAKTDRMSPSQVTAYERALDVAMAQTAMHPLSPYAIEGYRQCAQQIRSIGAAPIFLITPSTTQIEIATESTGLGGVLMAFNNPRLYPNLFRSSARRDAQHLSKSGAEEFTRLVAANFVELVRSGGIK